MQPTYGELFLQNQALMQQVQILTQQLKEAFAEIKTLKAKVKELEEKLNTNSSNSSKAPSQDPFRLPQATVFRARALTRARARIPTP